MEPIKVDGADKASLKDPIQKYAEMFLSNMQSQHYSPARQKDYRVALTILGRSMSEAGMVAEGLDEEIAIDLVMRSRRSPRANKQARYIVQSFVRFVRQVEAADPESPAHAQRTEREALRRE